MSLLGAAPEAAVKEPRITDVLCVFSPQEVEKDCRDPPDYWTIHGLWQGPAPFTSC